MIEEIKNEIIDLTPLFGNKEGVCILRKEVFEILDKYKDKEIKFEDGSSKFAIVKVPKLDVDNIKNYNQPDYKSAFEELSNSLFIDGIPVRFDEDDLNNIIEKYNLGDE